MTRAAHRLKWWCSIVLLFVVVLCVFLSHRFDREYFNKTSLGPVGEGYYVVLNSDHNKLILPDHSCWVGKERDLGETVILSDSGIHPFSWTLAWRAHSAIISFRPERVYLYECSRLRRGYYTRMLSVTTKQPNQSIDATPTAVTNRAEARFAPSAGVHHH